MKNPICRLCDRPIHHPKCPYCEDHHEEVQNVTGISGHAVSHRPNSSNPERVGTDCTPPSDSPATTQCLCMPPCTTDHKKQVDEAVTARDKLPQPDGLIDWRDRLYGQWVQVAHSDTNDYNNLEARVGQLLAEQRQATVDECITRLENSPIWHINVGIGELYTTGDKTLSSLIDLKSKPHD